MFSLSKFVGETKSRSVKKAFFYTLLIVAVYVAVAVVVFTVNLYDWIVNGSDWMFGNSMPPKVKAWLFIGVSNGLFLLWLIGRLWYKYVHMEEKAATAEDRLIAFMDGLKIEGLKALMGIDRRITIDKGTQGFDSEDLAEIKSPEDEDRLGNMEWVVKGS